METMNSKLALNIVLGLAEKAIPGEEECNTEEEFTLQKIMLRAIERVRQISKSYHASACTCLFCQIQDVAEGKINE